MKKNNNKCFTLIELLVVVAIIGILAAVGVVAYNGYISSAKKSSTKAIHNNVMKFIASEYTKCDLDGSASNTIMKKGGTTGLSCNVGTDDEPQKPAPSDIVTHLTGDDTPLEDKNPYVAGTDAVRESTDAGAGFVSLNADDDNDTIAILTCFDDEDCSSEDNQLSNSVTIE